MQRILYAIVTDPAVDPNPKTRAALAWEKLEDRKRIIRGKPLPGSLKPERVTRRKEKYWSEPQSISEPEQATPQSTDASDTSEPKGA